MDATESNPSGPSSDSTPEVPSDGSEARPMPTTRRRREADDWALVLRAEGFDPRVVRRGGAYHFDVAPEHRDAAQASLEAWRIERAERAARVPLPPPRPTRPMETGVAYALALSMLAFHLGLEANGRRQALIEIGSSQTDKIMAGHFERLLTALTLHSDLPHVLGNTLFGGFFLAVLAPRLGVGVGLLFFVITGALGNLANAFYYGVAHDSIGASTGVFGLVGVLAGFAAWHRQQTAPSGRGAWVALGAGLGILAMLGTGGPRVDVSAHLFGLLAGAVTGGLIAIPMASRPPPRTGIQIAASLVAAGLLFVAWRVAFQVAA